MDGMFQRLELFVLSCVFLSVGTRTGQIPAPQNVSLQWVEDFYPQLSWAPPPSGSLDKSCKYVAESGKLGNINFIRQDLSLSDTSWNPKSVMEGGSSQLSITVRCGNQISDKVDRIINYQDLVSNLECYIETSSRSHCSWLPISNTTDLRFFYWFKSLSDGNKSPLKECSSYSKTGNRVGCDMRAELGDVILILFKTTRNNTVIRNTYEKMFKDVVRAPPLNWTVTRRGDSLIIQWVPPEMINLLEWKFTIDYSECGQKKELTEYYKNSTTLPLVAGCPYIIKIKGDTKDGTTPWSDEKRIDPDPVPESGPNGLMYATFIIPLCFTILAGLAFAFCRKNKETIFPKVPEPRDFLSDISDNNNKSTVCDLYIPAKEEDDCKITLVIDPQNKLNP